MLKDDLEKMLNILDNIIDNYFLPEDVREVAFMLKQDTIRIKQEAEHLRSSLAEAEKVIRSMK